MVVVSTYQRMTRYEKIITRLEIFRQACSFGDFDTYEACAAYVAKSMRMTKRQLEEELKAFYRASRNW